MSSKQLDRVYVTAISIRQGIIQLIEPDGSIGYYRQRGIGQLSNAQIHKLIMSGLLHTFWNTVPELPRHYSISFEDEEIMGKARAAFPVPKEMRKGK